MSRETGIPWHGRSYKQDDWKAGDPVNRALSAANASLYGLCHGAIVATGFSPGLGFVHVGKQLSFVYDIADLYKLDVTVPAAFHAARDGSGSIETRVRKNCRDLFQSTRLLERIVPDLQRVLGLVPEKARLVVHRGDEEAEPRTGEAPEEGLGEAPGGLCGNELPKGRRFNRRMEAWGASEREA
jgi:CRISPR-associated protein Cas1